jgi:hypothetical protein
MLWLLFFLRVFRRRRHVPASSFKKLSPGATELFQLGNDPCLLFVDFPARFTYDLVLANSLSSTTYQSQSRKFLVLTGSSFSITSTLPISIFLWHIPRSLCDGFYAISSDGELFGELIGPRTSGPICLVSRPFVQNFQMSSLLTCSTPTSNVTVQYYIDHFHRPFSDCEPCIECLFWHTQPFVMRIAWATGAKFKFSLKYQTDTMRHSDRPCFLGPIRGPENVTALAEEFYFTCQDKEEQEIGQFHTIFLVALALCVGVVLLHCFGVVNVLVCIGCEDEQRRFQKIREELKLALSELPIDDQINP